MKRNSVNEQSFISSYFKKIKCENEEATQEECSSSSAQNDCTVEADNIVPEPGCSFKSATNETQMLIHENNQDNPSPWDISLFLKNDLQGQGSIPKMYCSIWCPCEKFQFPRSGKRNLRFKAQWLNSFHWLAYSKLEDAAYCKVCTLFAKKRAGIGSQPLKGLVTEPYRNWKKALEYFQKHDTHTYHRETIMKLENLKKIESGSIMSIDLTLNAEKQRALEENKKKIIAIADTIKLCGQQCLALRGSKDSGKIATETPAVNDGNFRAVLRYRSKTDELLRNHLETAPKNALYTSNIIQNQVISIFQKKILDHLVQRINKSKAFSLLADETTDVGGIEQLSICVRYVDKHINNSVVKEDFIGFIPMTDCSGKNIAKTAIHFLKEATIDTNYLYGQGYDGAAAMSGIMNGAQAIIQQDHPLALYVHCASHCLNLAVSSASNIPAIRNCLGSIESIYNFFNSPKRQCSLQAALSDVLPEAKHVKLKKYCPTRWIERHQSISIYCELQEGVIVALENISQLREAKVTADAFQLVNTIKNCQFQICCQVLLACHAILTPLSTALQRENLILTDAVILAQNCIKELRKMRGSANDEFKKMFKQSNIIMNNHNIPINIPRLCKKQQQRSNIEADSPEMYYRVTIFIPFLDELINHIDSRFLKHGEILSSFDCLFSQKQSSLNEESCRTLFKMYESMLGCINEVNFLGEVKMWRRRLQECGELKGDIFHALDLCEESEAFPNVRSLLRILAVLPVTTATAERSFSTLRRLKTYLRNSMTSERLNGLAMLNIHRDIDISSEEIAKEFAKSKRKMLLSS